MNRHERVVCDRVRWFAPLALLGSLAACGASPEGSGPDTGVDVASADRAAADTASPDVGTDAAFDGASPGTDAGEGLDVASDVPRHDDVVNHDDVVRHDDVVTHDAGPASDGAVGTGSGTSTAVCSPSPCVPGPRVTAATIRSMTSTDGLGHTETRYYYVYRPAHLANSPSNRVPLMMVLHGSLAASTPSVLAEIQSIENSASDAETSADANRYIVVFPATITPTSAWRWNQIAAGPPDHLDTDRVFLVDLVNRLLTEENVDAARVYSQGCSSGGMMTDELACDPASSGVFRGYAPVSATMQALLADPTHPSCPATNARYAFLNIWGRSDTAVPIAGQNTATKHFLSGTEFDAFWSGHLGCSGAATTSAAGSGGEWSAQTFSACASHPARFTVVATGQHCYDTLHVGGLAAPSYAWDYLSSH